MIGSPHGAEAPLRDLGSYHDRLDMSWRPPWHAVLAIDRLEDSCGVLGILLTRQTNSLGRAVQEFRSQPTCFPIPTHVSQVLRTADTHPDT